MLNFDLQLFGGGGGKGGDQTVTSVYRQSAQEQALADKAVNYANQNAGTISNINNQLNNLATNNFGLSNSVDYSSLLGTANNQIASAQNTIGNLANGQLSDEFKQNMKDVVNDTVTSTVGNAVNQLGNRGVLNSSVTNKATNDIEKNVANATAQQYLNSLGTSSQLAGQQANMAGMPISTAQQAQSAAYQPLSNAISATSNLENVSVNSPLSAMRGGGATTQTSSDGSSGIGGLLGTLASGYLSKAMGRWF